MRKFLKPKLYDQIDFDTVESMQLAVSNIKNKKCLHDIYVETYQLMDQLANRFLKLEGKRKLELGSGGGFIKDVCPDMITSDVIASGNVDMVIDAQSLPFADGELDAIYAMHVLHHIPDVTKFLKEAERTLHTGGGIILIEPYWGPFASILYRYAHPEPFDKKAKEWTVSGGNMSGSNQALSYILLKRDRETFESMFPHLKVVYDKPFNCLRYIATGGVWLQPKLPSFMFTVLKYVEKVCAPAMYIFGIHHVFVLKKE